MWFVHVEVRFGRFSNLVQLSRLPKYTSEEIHRGILYDGSYSLSLLETTNSTYTSWIVSS
jgi:hypothetical protein